MAQKAISTRQCSGLTVSLKIDVDAQRRKNVDCRMCESVRLGDSFQRESHTHAHAHAHAHSHSHTHTIDRVSSLPEEIESHARFAGAWTCFSRSCISEKGATSLTQLSSMHTEDNSGRIGGSPSVLT